MWRILVRDERPRAEPPRLPGRDRGRTRVRWADDRGRGQGTREGPEARPRDLPERWGQPTRDLGPEAGDRHRRAVPGDPDVGPGRPHLRAVAGDRQAHAPVGARPRDQHQGRRARPRDDHAHRPADEGHRYPQIRAVAAKLLGPEGRLPGIQITPRGGSGFNKQDLAFLGPRFASVTLADGKPPADLFGPRP